MACFKDLKCILSSPNPSGIPAWKIFSFLFWADPGNPLGGPWTLSPEPWALGRHDEVPNTYLGYSVESSCLAQKFISHSSREKKAYAMGKLIRFFQVDGVWSPDDYDAAANATGLSFVIGAMEDPVKEHNPTEDIPLPKSLKNLGILKQSQFVKILSESQLLIGVGEPGTWVPLA